MHVAAILESKGTEIVTLAPERTLAEAARVLAERRIGSVLIRDENHEMLGILTERDIVRALARLGVAALEAPARDHMTADVRTTRRDAHISQVMESMTNGRFRHMPVLEQGRLVGIVSIGDVVKLRLAQIEAEASAMREYISTA